jgi:hypothetical protein
MALPAFDDLGDLPPGVYRSTLADVVTRFGGGTEQRRAVTAVLERIYRLFRETHRGERFIIFGSFVTAKTDPNDVDIVMVMRDDFEFNKCEGETRMLFDHLQAGAIFGTSVFWIRPCVLFRETVDEFIAHWQIKRDLSLRGIVEVIE